MESVYGFSGYAVNQSDVHIFELKNYNNFHVCTHVRVCESVDSLALTLLFRRFFYGDQIDFLFTISQGDDR